MNIKTIKKINKFLSKLKLSFMYTVEENKIKIIIFKKTIY